MVNKSLIIFPRIWCGFMGFVYLFGQLFFSSYSLTDTVIGLSGILLAVLSGWLLDRGSLIDIFIVVLSCFVLLGLSIDAFEYYSKEQIVGNSHPNILVISFGIAALLLCSNALSHLWGKAYR